MSKRKKINDHVSGVFSNFDNRIIVVFLVLLIFGAVFWLFQRKDYVDCEDAVFYIIGDKFSTNEVITFNNQSYNAKTWDWNFGDGSKIEHRQQVMHKYRKEGVYTVTLTINGTCEVQQQIEIKNFGAIINQSKVPTIFSKKIVEVGAPVHFNYEYSGEPYSWEWSFGESGEMDNTQPDPTYIYQTPGTKNVTLIVNGDVKHIATQRIFVKPRTLVKRTFKDDSTKAYVYEKDPEAFKLEPGEPQIDPMEEFLEKIPLKPSPKNAKKDTIVKNLEIAPDVSEDQFELLLMQVANQSKTKDDFGKYTCGNYDIPVVVNGRKLKTFSEFCKSIKGKEIKIEALRLTKDNLNCVDGFSINYKVKKFLHWGKDD